MNLIGRLILWTSILMCTCSSVNAQIYLQLERANSTKTIKFFVGDILEFKLKEFPKTWRQEEILAIKPEANTIVFEDNFYNISEFHTIRLTKPWAKSIGTNIMYFSAAWFTYGGIATLADSGYTMSKDEIIIGGVFAAVGYLIRTLFHKKKIKLNKRKRLRIMDLRMTVPDN